MTSSKLRNQIRCETVSIVKRNVSIVSSRAAASLYARAKGTHPSGANPKPMVRNRLNLHSFDSVVGNKFNC